MTINRMITAIEKKVCIRMIWRCRAGWGMKFVLENNEEVVYGYQSTLEACVKENYGYWVLYKNVRGYPKSTKLTEKIKQAQRSLLLRSLMGEGR